MKRSAPQFDGVPNKRQQAGCSISKLCPMQKSCMESNSDSATGLLCGAEDCDSCFARSLASHHRVASFLAANPLENVFRVSKMSHSTYSWQCFDCDNVFKATCFIVMLDTWCPKCTRKVQKSQKELWLLKTMKIRHSSTSLSRESDCQQETFSFAGPFFRRKPCEAMRIEDSSPVLRWRYETAQGFKPMASKEPVHLRNRPTILAYKPNWLKPWHFF